MFELPRLWALLQPEQSHGRMEPTGMIHTASLHMRLKRDHSVSTSCAECVAYNFFFFNSCLLQCHGSWPPTLQLKTVWLVHSGYMAEAGEVSSVQLEGWSCLPGHLLPPVLSVKSCWNVWLSGHPRSERGDASRGRLSPPAREGGGCTWSRTIDHPRVPPSQQWMAAAHHPFPGEVAQTSLVPADILAPGAPSLSPDPHPQGLVVD